MRKIRATVTIDIETVFDDNESTVQSLLYCLLEDLNDTGLYTVYDIKGRANGVKEDG